jgi:hypothetical protein
MINRIRPIAIEVTVNEDSFIVRLQDGGKLHVPLHRFPNLLAATPEQRKAVRISASGAGLHWDQLNEVISINKLMRDAERRHLQKRLKSVRVAVKVDIDKL